MRDLKSGVEHPKSLGYAFVAFEEHGDALKALHALNNNNSILGGNRVSHSSFPCSQPCPIALLTGFFACQETDCGVLVGKLKGPREEEEARRKISGELMTVGEF